MKGLLIMASTIALLTGCSSVSVKDYKNESPKLVLEDYLNGNLEAHGFFQDRSGMIVKRFKVLMKGTWTGDTGILDESFEYSDGTKSKRVWTLKKTAEGKYTGTASDVIGEAHGESAGNAFHWKYTLDLPVGDSNYHVKFDDWMYLMDDKIMLNKSKMSKFGVYLGEVTLVFIKGGSNEK
ncbi:MAG: hypothetical protein CL676_04200 [Bdellovibrionaceae bacterium]|nr:hypothetical protein [Pseudobdellovibrionaceae bacterium]|tara:strand:+ start:1508 stop:2047 length:540 start_codon:yes stop_codon:yes gene_type:complete